MDPQGSSSMDPQGSSKDPQDSSPQTSDSSDADVYPPVVFLLHNFHVNCENNPWQLISSLIYLFYCYYYFAFFML